MSDDSIDRSKDESATNNAKDLEERLSVSSKTNMHSPSINLSGQDDQC